MNFWQFIVQLLCLLGSCKSLLRPQTILLHRVHPQACVGNASIGKSKLGICLQRLIEEIQCRLIAFFVVAAQGIPPPQIQIIRSGVVGRPGLRRGALFIGRVDIEARDELIVDLILQREQIAYDAVKFLAPDSLAIRHVLQLHDDADLVPCGLQRALHEQVGSQCARDFLQRLLLIRLVGRLSGADSNVFQLKKLCRKCLLDTLGHVAKLRRISEDLEREDGNESTA